MDSSVGGTMMFGATDLGLWGIGEEKQVGLGIERWHYNQWAFSGEGRMSCFAIMGTW